MEDKKKKRLIVGSSIGLVIAVAAYFGVTVPAELSAPLTDAVCAVSGWC